MHHFHLYQRHRMLCDNASLKYMAPTLLTVRSNVNVYCVSTVSPGLVRAAASQDATLVDQLHLDFVEDLALALAGLEVLVSLNDLLEREDLVDAHLELSVLQPAEDVIGALEQLSAVDRVVEELGAREEGRLANEAQHGEGGHGARGSRWRWRRCSCRCHRSMP